MREQRAARRVEKELPNNVAVRGSEPHDVTENGFVCPVAQQQIVAWPVHDGGRIDERIERRADRIGKRRRDRRGRCRGVERAGEHEQICSFVSVELQSVRDRAEHVERYVDFLALLEARVPRLADVR